MFPVQWSNLKPWVRALLVWLLVFFLFQAFSTVGELIDFKDYGNPGARRAGFVLRTVFLVLLPLLCVIGIQTRAPWARIVCLIYLPVAALYEIGILAFLLRMYQESSSIIIGPRPEILPYLAGHLFVVIINAVFFFLLLKRGIEESHRPGARAYSKASIS